MPRARVGGDAQTFLGSPSETGLAWGSQCAWQGCGCRRTARGLGAQRASPHGAAPPPPQINLVLVSFTSSSPQPSSWPFTLRCPRLQDRDVASPLPLRALTPPCAPSQHVGTGAWCWGCEGLPASREQPRAVAGRTPRLGDAALKLHPSPSLSR